MTTYEVGQVITWGFNTYSIAGALADISTAAATVTLPDGTTTAGTVTNTAVGVYDVTVTSTLAGRYRVRFTGTGGGLPYTDVADVWPTDPRLIISLADARAALNVASGSRVNDDELRSYLVGAGIVIEHLAGTASGLTQTKVESRDGDGRMGISLYEMPASITSVVEAGTTLASTDYYLDSAGILWRGASKGAGTWSTSGRTVVTYVTGSSTLGENVKLAAAHLIRHWWNQTQQSYRPYMGGTGGYGVPQFGNEEPGAVLVAGYAVPNFVADMLAPSMANRMPGMA